MVVLPLWICAQGVALLDIQNYSPREPDAFSWPPQTQHPRGTHTDTDSQTSGSLGHGALESCPVLSP